MFERKGVIVAECPNDINTGKRHSKKKKSIGHLTIISAKVTIKMVKLSNNFGKNLWGTFTQMRNEKNISFKF